MPVLSSTTSSTSMSNVSDLPSDIVGKLVALVKKYDESQQFTCNLLIGIRERIQSLEKGEGVHNSYSTETLNLGSSASPTSTSQSLYSVPSNYFAGQLPPPRSPLTCMAEPVRPVLPTSQTGAMVASPATSTPIVPIISSAGFSRMNELANIDSSYTTVVCSVPPIPP